MICPNCQTENRDSAKYCDECGFPLQGKIAEAAAAVGGEQTTDEELGESLKSVVKEASQEDPFSNAHTQSLPKIDAETELKPVDLRNDPSTSGAISANAIPTIEVAGINADENGEPYNLEEALYEGEDAPADNVAESEGQPDSEIVEESYVENSDADLSGFETTMFGERIKDPYEERFMSERDAQQPNNWHDGATMQMPAVEGAEQPKSRDFKETSVVKKNHKKRNIIIALIVGVIVIVAAVLGVTYALQIWGGKSIPDVTGMTQSEATNVLQSSGFTVRSTQVKSDDTEGLVLIMDPIAGTRQEAGSEVVIHVSVARSIPKAVGKTLDETKSLMEAEGFKNVTYETQYSDEAEGTVLSISPEPGTRAKENTAITVKVATPYTVPDVKGMYLSDAQEAITDAGLSPYVVYVDTTEYPEGQIFGTDPAAGSKVKGGSDVAIQIAVQRSTELITATKALIYSGATITINSTNYYVSSLDACSYLGNDQTSFTMTASPYVMLLGEMVQGSPRSVSGVIQWTSSNTVDSISAS